MTHAQIVIDSAINPALDFLPSQLDTRAARVLMLAISLQEDPTGARAQILNGGGRGPARGLWQFEMGGGVKGVLNHKASKGLAASLCFYREVDATPRAVWEQLEFDDVLAAGFARLLILTDPYRLPAVGDVAGAWALYAERLWRPGKPHPKKWPANYATALKELSEP